MQEHYLTRLVPKWFRDLWLEAQGMRRFARESMPQEAGRRQD
jgi:hypothetical protein